MECRLLLMILPLLFFFLSRTGERAKLGRRVNKTRGPAHQLLWQQREQEFVVWRDLCVCVCVSRLARDKRSTHHLTTTHAQIQPKAMQAVGPRTKKFANPKGRDPNRTLLQHTVYVLY